MKGKNQLLLPGVRAARTGADAPGTEDAGRPFRRVIEPAPTQLSWERLAELAALAAEDFRRRPR